MMASQGSNAAMALSREIEYETNMTWREIERLIL